MGVYKCELISLCIQRKQEKKGDYLLCKLHAGLNQMVIVENYRYMKILLLQNGD